MRFEPSRAMGRARDHQERPVVLTKDAQCRRSKQLEAAAASHDDRMLVANRNWPQPHERQLRAQPVWTANDMGLTATRHSNSGFRIDDIEVALTWKRARPEMHQGVK